MAIGKSRRKEAPAQTELHYYHSMQSDVRSERAPTNYIPSNGKL